MPPAFTTKTLPVNQPPDSNHQGVRQPRRGPALSLTIICFLTISLYPAKGVTMSLLFGTEVVLFPAMEGRLTFNGEPAADAEITVHVFWKDDVGEEELFQTDAEGKFSVPAKKRRVRIPPLAEFVVTQQMRVMYRGNEYVIWSKAAMGTDPYGGLGGEIDHIHCELTNKREKKEIADGLFSTSCQWTIAE